MKHVLFLALLAVGAVSCTQEAGVEATTESVDTTVVADTTLPETGKQPVEEGGMLEGPGVTAE